MYREADTMEAAFGHRHIKARVLHRSGGAHGL